jgi:hypothetical protein
MVRCPKCPHDIPEGNMRCIYCGAALPDAVSVPRIVREPDEDNALERGDNKNLIHIPETPEQDLLLKFSMKRAKRREPMSKVALLILFLVSFAFGGLLVWLLR